MVSIDIAWPEPPPPATAAVDAAIELFSLLLPLQDLSSCSRVVSDLVQSVQSPKLERNTGRKAAVLANASIAIALALRNATTMYSRQSRDSLGSAQVSAMLATFLKVCNTVVSIVLGYVGA